VESINPVERTDAQDVDERHQETKSGQEIDAQAQVKTVPYVKAEQLKRLEKAQRDLKALGKINPLATEEYDALQTRNQYLHDQRNDVAQSRDDLMKLIKDLDATMVEVFTSAFADTARAFEKVFATLFPGGTGRLRLENPDDPLTTGVIVEASPAGKRVKQLSLLSGGERSLTALALLFAIFTARPSPFYVMDEVEAALDDVNLTRLLNALNDLREHAQLIIITHQQRTMSIADALYGVTMRSDGVTAVMSQKLAHGKSD
jgi:chromosome segregation protein